MWETLSPVNHILSMRPASSICSLYLQGFALITSGEKYRVEVEEGANISECLTVVFQVVQDAEEIGTLALISSRSGSAHVAALLIMETSL